MESQSRFPLYWRVLTGYVFVFALIFVLISPQDPDKLRSLSTTRIIFLVFVYLCYLSSKYLSGKYRDFAQWLLAYSSLSFLYKDTAVLNTMSPIGSIDSFLMKVDSFIFGFQPSLEFSKVFASAFFSELFFSAYFFYYLFPLILGCYLLIKNPCKIVSFATTLIVSFVIYYIVFISVPAYGPQFFFSPPENQIQGHGFFSFAVKLIQANGEAPTAAFPSSHVGVSVIILLWILKNDRKILKWFIAPVVVLCFSTVYIKAHYAIDVIFGLISGVFIYKFLDRWILK